MNNLVNLLDLDADALTAYCGELGEKPFRARQLQRWIHQFGASHFDAMTDLAKSLREKLATRAEIRSPAAISDNTSSDGTRKWLLDVGDGNAVETVYIPEDTRGTLCVSSQAGCAVNCRFCSTGKQGFSRNLSTGEIIGQLWMAEFAMRAQLGRGPKDERVISNVVMMGMGEPLLNYDAVVPAMRLMLDDNAYGLSRRRVTLSTSGVVPMMDRLSKDLPVALAVSLHASNDALRDVARAAQPQVPAGGADGGLSPLPGIRAARFHYFRILHARWRQRWRRTCAGTAEACGRRALQVQPDSVQPVPGIGAEALEQRADSPLRPGIDGCGDCHDDPQNTWRRHRRRVWPACWRSHGSYPSGRARQVRQDHATGAGG